MTKIICCNQIEIIKTNTSRLNANLCYRIPGVLGIGHLYYRFVPAIDLENIAHFPDEEEVLLLPFPLFKFEQITTDPIHGNIEIALMYANSPSKSCFQA
ncbi:unnamed protein product [Adineta ricciae]|uniref:Uncharacterized protein n=1 Tax=Adineta ricciae TaxID=249248 RepID=A0A816C0D0_ADIRI|nr:unnamed protein product [Adineta ricciae]